MNSTIISEPSTNRFEEELLQVEPISLNEYVPFFLGSIANRWTAVSSKAYRSKFKLGIGEWRILASLAVTVEATALEITTLLKMDSGHVSRAMRVLEKRKLVQPVPGRFAGRNKPYMLTEQGVVAFSEMKTMALAREQKLLAPLDDEQRKLLLDLLGHLYGHLDEIES